VGETHDIIEGVQNCMIWICMIVKKKKSTCRRQKPFHFDQFPQAVFWSAFFHSSISSVESVLSRMPMYSSSLGGRGAHTTGEEGGEASLWEVRGGAHAEGGKEEEEEARFLDVPTGEGICSGTTGRWAIGDKPKETGGLLACAEVPEAGV
jgi:hypothetical protein